MNLNSVTVTGRLTANPELRYSPEGTAFATFGLAVNRPPRGGQDQQPVWIDVIVFGAQAEAVGEHLAKGRKVGVVGRLDLDRWVGNDNTLRTRHKIVASDVEFLDQPRPAAPVATAAAAAS